MKNDPASDEAGSFLIRYCTRLLGFDLDRLGFDFFDLR